MSKKMMSSDSSPSDSGAGADRSSASVKSGHPARRHHTLPQFYLRGFSDDDKVATIRLPGESRFIQSVRKASSVIDFYTIPGHADGDDAVEKSLAHLERAAARVFMRIDRGTWPLGADDRETLALFIAVQATRVPSQRETLNHMAAQMMRLQVGAGGKQGLRRRLESTGGGEMSQDDLDTMWELITRRDGPPIELAVQAFVGQMFSTALEILKYLAGRPWALVEFDRRSLITSDVPVGLIPGADADPWQGIGYMTAFAISFPLSRKKGLMMMDPMTIAHRGATVDLVRAGLLDVRQAGTTALEKTINSNTIASAAEWLFLHPDDRAFVPAELPSPNPIKMKMNGPESFSGEPWFPRRE